MTCEKLTVGQMIELHARKKIRVAGIWHNEDGSHTIGVYDVTQTHLPFWEAYTDKPGTDLGDLRTLVAAAQ